MEKKRLVRAALVDDLWIGHDGENSCIYTLNGTEIDEDNR